MHNGRSNATSSNRTFFTLSKVPLKELTLLSAKFRILLCVWISIVIQNWKSQRKGPNQRKFQSSRRPTASSRQSAANQHRVFDVICKCIVGKRTDFPDQKTKHKRWAIQEQSDESRMGSASWTYLPFSKSEVGAIRLSLYFCCSYIRPLVIRSQPPKVSGQDEAQWSLTSRKVWKIWLTLSKENSKWQCPPWTAPRTLFITL